MSQNKPQPPPAAAPSGSVEVWADTHPGRRREANEDNVYPRAGASRGPIRVGAAKMAAKGHLAIVADGVGGAQVGARVSARAVEYVSDGYYDGQHPDAGVNLKQAVESAGHWLHDLIRRDPAYSRAATTLTAAVILGNTLHVAHVGDSRAYLVRSGQITQLTRDHTLAQEKFDAGYIQKREDIRNDPGHSTLTRSLGIHPQVQVDVHRQALAPGDVVVLCSDGLYDEIGDDDIRAVAERETPKKAVKTLIKRANRAGGHDNISVAILRLPGGPPAAGWTAWQRAALVFLSIAIVAMIGALAVTVAQNLLGSGATPPATAPAEETSLAPAATPGVGLSPAHTVVAAVATRPPTPRYPTSTAIQPSTPQPATTHEPNKTPAATPIVRLTSPSPTSPGRRSPTPKPKPSAPPAPILLKPEPGVNLSTKWRFEWQWNHPELPPDQAFDLLIWSEEEKDLPRGQRRGAISPWQETYADVEVGEVATVKEHGEGTYYWTVIVVHKAPYKRIGRWGEERPFVYSYPVPPPDTPVPPTDTPAPPTDTPVPPTEAPTPTKPPGATAAPNP